MAIQHRVPERNNPLFSTILFPKIIPVSWTLTSGGGVQTATGAQTIAGLWLVDCQDAQTITLPTATLLSDAIPGVGVGTSFYLDVTNYGDTTLTIGLGTGITKTTIATVAPVMTVITLVTKRFLLNCTAKVGVANSASDAWVVYNFGSPIAASILA